MNAYSSVKFSIRDIVEGKGPSKDVPCMSLQQGGKIKEISFNTKCISLDNNGNKVIQPVKFSPVPNKLRDPSGKAAPIYPTVQD